MQSVGWEEVGPHQTLRLGEVVIGAIRGLLFLAQRKKKTIIFKVEPEMASQDHKLLRQALIYHYNTSDSVHLSEFGDMEGLTQFSKLPRSTMAIISFHSWSHFAAYKGHSCSLFCFCLPTKWGIFKYLDFDNGKSQGLSENK